MHNDANHNNTRSDKMDKFTDFLCSSPACFQAQPHFASLSPIFLFLNLVPHQLLISLSCLLISSLLLFHFLQSHLHALSCAVGNSFHLRQELEFTDVFSGPKVFLVEQKNPQNNKDRCEFCIGPLW